MVTEILGAITGYVLKLSDCTKKYVCILIMAGWENETEMTVSQTLKEYITWCKNSVCAFLSCFHYKLFIYILFCVSENKLVSANCDFNKMYYCSLFLQFLRCS